MTKVLSLLRVEALQISLGEQSLVDPLYFELAAGETLGIVGESGSGKSLSSLALMGLLASELRVSGQAFLGESPLIGQSQAQWRKRRGRELAMIFQEPMSALNPSMRCGAQIEEALRQYGQSAGAARAETLRLLAQTELADPQAAYRAYPHELSGGQKQRVMIAMALSGRPRVLIADEPTTALDPSVQASILALLRKLQSDYGMAMIFISHDLGVVAQVADRILVMHRGATCEYGACSQVFSEPAHPYTRGLLACRPGPHSYSRRLPLVRDFIEGSPEDQAIISPALKDERAQQLTEQKPLLRVRDLHLEYAGRRSWRGRAAAFPALRGVNLDIFPGESLGLVGESGSGKSSLGRVLCGLERATRGELYYQDQSLMGLSAAQWRPLRKEIQIIFQDPFASLNPRLAVGEAIAEVLHLRAGVKPQEARREAEQLLERVGLLKDYYGRYPHEFSGGQRQRVGIARALAVDPRFIICDESVSALDVSVQAQIINLLKDLQEERGLTYLFISHDLNVVRYFCDRVLVLRAGEIVETGYAEALYRQPEAEYTQQLVAASGAA